MKLIFKFLIVGIILGIIFSMFYVKKYTIISGYCEKNINNEILSKKIENEILTIITDKGVYRCKKNESKIEIKNVEKSFLNVPLNFERFYVENDERLKFLKVDYLKEDNKYYFKNSEVKILIEENKNLNFYLLESLKVKDGNVSYKGKEYSLEEFKNLEGIEIISQNETITFKKYLFNRSCLKIFDFSYNFNVFYYLNIYIEFKEDCREILEDELKYSHVKVIENEKYFEFPLLIGSGNETLLEIYIPFKDNLDKIEIKKVSMEPLNVEKLKLFKLYSLEPNKVYEERNFKLFLIDIVSIVIILFFLILSFLKKLKIEIFLLLSPLIFVFKLLTLSIIAMILVYLTIKRRFNFWILPIAFSSISLFFNPSSTLFFPFLSIVFSPFNKKFFIPIFFIISLVLFFFSESISLLFLSTFFLFSLKNLVEKES
jgi:hypothetical protein